MKPDVIKIDYGTVKPIFRCENTNNPDKLLNNFCKIIYSFFETFEFGKIYQITNCNDLPADLHSIGVAERNVEFLNGLGIYFEGQTLELALPKLNYFMVESEFVNVFKDKPFGGRRSLKEYILAKHPDFNFSKPCYCAVQCDFSHSSLVECINVINEINSTFSQVIILNTYLNVIYSDNLCSNNTLVNVEYYKKRLPNCKYLNLFKYIYDNCIYDIEITSRAIKARKLINQLRMLAREYESKGQSIIFYYRRDPKVQLPYGYSDDTFNDVMESLYVSFCIVLTTFYGCKCVIHNSIQQLYMFNYSCLLAQDNMYVKDYLTMLEYFPDVTISFANGMSYYCVIDYDKLRTTDPNFRKAYRYELTLTSIKYNPKTGQWLSMQIESAKYNYYDIKVLDFHDYFDLNSKNLKEASKALTQFSELIVKFKHNLQSKDVSPKDVMHQGNILLYEFNGETYLGFVSEINRKLPFILYPADFSYEPFKMDIDNSVYNNVISLGNLHCITTDLDWKNTLTTLQKRGAKFSVKRLLYKLPNYSKCYFFSYILNKTFQYENVKDSEHASDENVFATVDELGIWCESAKQFRKGATPGDSHNYERLKNLFNLDALRDKIVLTAFGGLHPYISTQIEIQPGYINYKRRKK